MGGGGGDGRTTQSVRGNYKSFKGTNLTVVEGMHQFIMHIRTVSPLTSEERAVYSKGWGVGGAKETSISFGSHGCRGLLYAWC